MSALAVALDELRAELTAAGVPAAVDENDVPVPGAWIAPQSVRYDRLSGSTWRVDVFLIVGAMSSGPAVAALDALHARVVPKVLTPDADATVTAVALPFDPSTPLPALRLPVDLNL